MGEPTGRRQFLIRAAAAVAGVALGPTVLTACQTPVAGRPVPAGGTPGGGASGGGTSGSGTSDGGTSDGDTSDGDTSGVYGASGVIMFDWATSGVLTIDLSSGKSGVLMPQNVSRYGWDVSGDGKRLLQATEGGDPDTVRFSYTTIADDAVIWSFDYQPTEGELTYGWISPDEKMIAVAPTSYDGVVVLDTRGNTLHSLTSLNGQQVGQNAEIVWMPDNSLLVAVDEGIYRTDTAFTKASPIRSMNYSSWGDIAASPDGTKISFTAGRHIWMMNSDGSNLVQVTDSSAQEGPAAFSTDGSKLLIGTDYHTTGSFASIWYLAIMPADGKMHNVDKGADSSVVFIKDTQNGISGQGCTGFMYWR